MRLRREDEEGGSVWGDSWVFCQSVVSLGLGDRVCGCLTARRLRGGIIAMCVSLVLDV